MLISLIVKFPPLSVLKSNLISRNISQSCRYGEATLKCCVRKTNQNCFYRFKSTASGKETKAAKIKFKQGDVRRLIGLAKKEKLVIAGAIGCLIISSGITMAVPYGLGKILDVVYKDQTNEEAKEKLKKFCLILVGVFLVGGLANFGRVYLFNNASLRIVQNLRSRLYQKMLSQEAGWFDTKGTGELVNRLSTDTFLVGNSLSQNLSDGLRSLVMISAGTGMMIYTSWQLSLVGLAVVPCVAGMAIVYGKYVKNITRQVLDKMAVVMKTGEERLGNVKTVKIFCKEQQENQLFLDHLTDALKLGYKETKAKAIFYGLTGLSGNIIIMSVLYYGGNLVASNEMTVGALTSFILYAGYSAISINGLSNFYTELNKGMGAAQRIWEIFDRKPLIENPLKPIEMTDFSPEIEFKDISFWYPTREQQAILTDLNLKIKPNTTTAIVGKSGSGKSTIGILLLRLYDPVSGQVSINGQDLKDVDLKWLRSKIGAVNQEPVLFSGTIKENILYGANPGTQISQLQFESVCKKAHVDEFVKFLPNGYDTIVGQRGMMLSGGQKQRVAIARALIKNPQILLLDEATSALDASSEKYVQEALESLTHGRTVLTIAHRLSTIRNADSIAVLDGGRIVEQGSYDELMTKPEFHQFRDLVKLQTFDI